VTESRAAFRVFRGNLLGRQSVEKRRLDKNEIRQRRQRREDFMNRLYQAVDGNVSEFVQGFDLAADLTADAEEARRIIAYLEEKGWIKVDDHRNGVIRITAAGVDAVETTTLG
jgi:predicted transcriptional regulator